MSNLDIQNIINYVKEIDPNIDENEPSFKRFMERFLEEAFQPENINKLSQQYITSITIENFKGIGDAVTIPIRPITLLFGKNSSGKSTVLQALRYYYAVCYNELDKIIKGSGGYHFDPKAFPSLVHRQELDRKIRIRIEYASALNAINKNDTQNQLYQWREVVTGWKKGHTYVVSLLLGFSINGEELCRYSWKPGEIPADMIVGSNGEELIRKKEKNKDLPLETYVNTNSDYKSLIDLFERIDSLREFEIAFSSIDPDIRHLGPFRELPPQDYKILQTSDESRWETGLGAWDVLSRDPAVVKKTNHYIQNILKLGYGINRHEAILLDIDGKIMTNLREIDSVDQLKEEVLDPIEQLPRQISMKLHDEEDDIDLDPSDVGIGIAQVIPVVVGVSDDSQSFKIFAVEQPELHVHPAVQVALGDVFIDSIKNSNHSTTQEALDRCFFRTENSKKELLDSIKNINAPAIEAVLDTIIGLIKDEDPLDVEVFLDTIIGLIKDEGPLDVRFKELFEIKEKYDYDIQVAIKELARGFLDSTADSNRTLLIETHSEHLLLRLLRRVRETNVRNSKKYEWRQSSMPSLHREMSEAAIRDAENQDSKDYQLTPNDLSVVYVLPTSEGVEFIPLPVTDDGDFDTLWPEGFFAERVKELF